MREFNEINPHKNLLDNEIVSHETDDWLLPSLNDRIGQENRGFDSSTTDPADRYICQKSQITSFWSHQ